MQTISPFFFETIPVHSAIERAIYIDERLSFFTQRFAQSFKPLTVSHVAYMRQYRKIQKRELRAAFQTASRA